ncbi:hypothetical protein LIER_43860 [Lithospermum erythrorhizon]|uniref:Retrotransposon gag domain-containing protein n=1 Tax=Lithospermum erythrorhizon TaxID=34254 RepID=A0AAV3R3J1_LITER
MEWEAERAAQDHALSSHAGNPSHNGHSYYTDNEELYSDMEVRTTTSVAPTPNQREHVQVLVVYSDPIVAAMQQQLDIFKKFMATAFPASIVPVAPKTKMLFSNRLDAFQLPPGFKLLQLELYDRTEDPIKHLHIAHMTITLNNPDVYPKAFPNSLTRKARDWYMVLPLKTIDTYQQTADAFVANFATAVQKRKMSEYSWIFSKAIMNL